MVLKKSLSEKTQGIWKFCQNTGNLFAQVVNSLIPKIQNIAIFVANFLKSCNMVDSKPIMGLVSVLKSYFLYTT